MASGNVKGIVIRFEGDTTKLDKALREITNNTKKLDGELKTIDKALKFNPGSVELWSQKQKVLTEKIEETKKRLDALKQAKEKADADPNVDKQSAEYRQLCRDIEITENQLKQFNAELIKVGNVKLTALGEEFKKVGEKMAHVGKEMTTKVSAPLAAVGGAAVKVGMDFDSSMSQVAATMGKPIDEIQELRDFAIEMGSTTAFSAKEAADGLNYMALAGYSSEQAMAMLPTVLNLAAAGNIDLANASDMVTDAQSALGLSTEETVAMVDQMAKASSTTNTSVEQLGSAFLTVGGTAKMMKGGTAELSQVLGILADNGVKGSEGGTALRNILLSLSAPTDKAAKQLEELGVEVFDAGGNMRSMEDIILDLNKSMEGMTSEEKTNAIASIFNKRDLKSVNALLGTSVERWDEVAAAVSDAGGAAETMANTQLDNLKGSLTLLKSALEGAAITVSDRLTPYIRKLADFITGLIDKFNNLSPEAQDFIVKLGLIVAAIGPVLLIVGKLTTGIGTVIGLVGRIGPLITTVTTAVGTLASTGLLPIIAVIAAVVAVGVLLYKNWDTIKAKAIALKTAVVQAFTNLKANVIGIWNAIKSSATATWNAIKTAMTNAITNAVSAVKTKISDVKTSISEAWSSIKQKTADAWSSIKEKITGPFKSAKETISSVISTIKGWFPISIGNLFSGLKLPHFSLNWATKDFGKLGSVSYPTGLNVSWYAKGGIFDSPSLIGVGEAGAEAVVPLDKFWNKLDKMQTGQNITININGSNKDPREIAEEVKRVLIRETNQRRLAWQ